MREHHTDPTKLSTELSQVGVGATSRVKPDPPPTEIFIPLSVLGVRGDEDAGHNVANFFKSTVQYE